MNELSNMFDEITVANPKDINNAKNRNIQSFV